MAMGEVVPQPSASSEVELRYQGIQAAVSGYDPSGPHASHLRQHQEEAIGAFRETVREQLTIDAFAEGKGIGLIMPTGSGKTVVAAEIMRMLKDGFTEVSGSDVALRALLLMPRKNIRNQTIGDEEQQGFQRFAPDLTIGTSATVDPTDPADVNLALYQGVTGLRNRGFLSRLNPNAVVCDEMHHIIDGSWARHITDLAPGRLLVGLTATPEYSPTRHTGDIFPLTAIRRTMRDGIESGYLSDLEGHIYMGKSRIEIGRGRKGDYDPALVFEALINSEDNYTAAKIVAQEVAKGRRGIVFCTKGSDRAHSKLMAKIISSIEIDTPTGRRHIRAVHVDGDTPESDFDDYREAMMNHEIDVFTNVDFMLEGTDIDVLEFAFIHRPTASKVMAEQRLGRILRFLPDKLATVHEFVYEFSKGNLPQITHADILQSERAVVGHSVKPPKVVQKPGPRKRFDSDDFTIDEAHLAKIDSLDAIPIEEIRVLCGQKVVPYDWTSVQQLAYSFGVSEEEISAVLKKAKVLPREEDHDSGHRVYYPPRAKDILVEKLDIPEAEEGAVTLHEIEALAKISPLYRHLSRSALRRQLLSEGHTPTVRRLPDGRVDRVYNAAAARSFLPAPVDWRAPRVNRPSKFSTRRRAAPKPAPAPRRSVAPRTEKPPVETGTREEVLMAVDEITSTLGWCETILVPIETANFRDQAYIQKGQENLLVAIRLSKTNPVPPVFKKLVAALPEVQPTVVMERLMTKHKIDFATLLFFARRAQRSTDASKRK